MGMLFWSKKITRLSYVFSLATLSNVCCRTLFLYRSINIEASCLLLIKIFWNALVTVSPFLSFKGMIQPYLLNTSITISKYLKFLLNSLKGCSSMRCDDHIWSILFAITRRRVKFHFIGLCSSLANFSCQLSSSLDGFFRFLEP